jgi:hypothetical protein
VTNEQCVRDSQHYLQELDNFALWALKSEYGVFLLTLYLILAEIPGVARDSRKSERIPVICLSPGSE